MLTPEQLERLPERIVELVSLIESYIIADMARRLSKMNFVTDTAAWQLIKLQELGATYNFAIAKMAELTAFSPQVMHGLFTEVGNLALNADDAIYRAAGVAIENWTLNSKLQQVLYAGLQKTNKTFENLTRTTANTLTKQFENALDVAHMQITSGAFSYQGAISRAVKSLTSEGLESVRYPSGKVDHLDVAARRATLTGINQSAAELQLARMDQMECDLVEITAHSGARPEHAGWQGRVFSRSGHSDKYPNFYDVTGYGTGPGLCGWNCRHNFYPFFEGLSEEAYTSADLERLNAKVIDYNGSKYTIYEAQQMQRQIERNIRKYKREYIGMEAAGLDTTKSAKDLARWREMQKDFARQTGLPVDNFRGSVAGFSHSQASKTVWQAKKAAQDILQYFGDVTPDMRSYIESELNMLPAKHRQFVESYLKGLNVLPADTSQSSRYVGQNIFLRQDAQVGTLVHESSHAIEDALKLYDDPAFRDIWLKGFENVLPDDIILDTGFSEPIWRIWNDKFISEYQGRIYDKRWQILLEDGSISLEGLREYFSEGYTEYILNPDNLKERDPDLFDFIRRLLA